MVYFPSSILLYCPKRQDPQINDFLAPFSFRTCRLLARSPEGLLQKVDQPAEAAKDVTQAKAPAADADRVDEEVDESPVGNAECEEDAKVCNTG